jgi:hypothetical protein
MQRMRGADESARNLTSVTMRRGASGASARVLVRARTEWQDADAFPLRIDTVTLTPQGPRYAHFSRIHVRWRQGRFLWTPQQVSNRDCDLAHAVAPWTPVLFRLRIFAQEL